MKRIKIAIIVPPFTTVPPRGQGGTERIAFYMIKGFQKRGYDVTLFGAGKCKTSAHFVQIFKKTISERKLNLSKTEASRLFRIEAVYMAKVIRELIKRKDSFDIVFNHCRGGYLFLTFENFFKVPIVNILHLPIFKEMADFISYFKKPNIVTISSSQKRGFPNINYLGTVYNGVDLEEFNFCQKPKDYFLFMGALGEHKNPKDAILSAKKARVKLKIAGGKKREPYFSREIKPLIDGKQIQYLGEVSGKKRINLLQEAKALLFPIKWPEPFGLVQIEAMACGTPVIAYSNGAVPEVIKDNKTGFIVKNVKEMAWAIKNINRIERRKCRERVEKYFTVEKMISGYEKVLKKIVKS